MNRLCCTIIAWCVCSFMAISPLYAQTGSASEVVMQIRNRYANAKEMISYNNMSLETQNQLTVNGSFMCPGTGHRDEQIQYFFLTDFDEDAGNFVSIPYFIIRSYNVAARHFYEEFLYDEHGAFIFSYLKGDDLDGGTTESRYYWNGTGELVYTQTSGQADSDAHSAVSLSADLLEAFQRLMKREF